VKILHQESVNTLIPPSAGKDVFGPPGALVAYLSLARCTEQYWLVGQLEGDYRAQPSWTINLHRRKNWCSGAPDGVKKPIIRRGFWVSAMMIIISEYHDHDNAA
jgi:hypothetical protein